MPLARVLVVDDDETIRFTLQKILQKKDFDVKVAASAAEALTHIAASHFDVLLTDLHMPNAGDGLTVVSAMKHTNPQAFTLLISGFPQMEAASTAILEQADAVLVKPVSAPALLDAIAQGMAIGPRHKRVLESVESILGRTTEKMTEEWLARVHLNPGVMTVAMADALRSDHLVQLFLDLRGRLLSHQPMGSTALVSTFAADHGRLRQNQGYTAAMMVEESRMLQVSIFDTLQQNLASIDFSRLLNEVMTIADEVDSQLSQAMASYIAASVVDALPGSPVSAN